MNKRDRILYLGLDAMMLLMSLLLLWAAESLGSLGVLLVPFMIFPSAVLTLERRIPALVLNYFLPAALILLLPFPHYAWFGFVFAAGWYAPLRELVSRIRAAWVGTILAILLSNAGIAAGFFLLSLVGSYPLSSLDPFWMTLLILGIELMIVLFDILYQLFCSLYLNTLRRFLLA